MLLQTLWLLNASWKDDLQTAHRISLSKSSQTNHSRHGHRHHRKPDEHYWDITTISSKTSSHMLERSVQPNRRHHKDEHYWEGTNVEPTRQREAIPKNGVKNEKDRRHCQHKQKQYWEGSNEEPVNPQLQTSQCHKHRHAKPYWE